MIKLWASLLKVMLLNARLARNEEGNMDLDSFLETWQRLIILIHPDEKTNQDLMISAFSVTGSAFYEA